MEHALLLAMLLGAAVTLLTHWLWKRRHFYIFAYQFPCTLWGLPIIGLLLKMGSIYKIMTFVHNQWKSCRNRTFLGFFAMVPIIVTVDPEVIRYVLTQSALFIEKARTLYDPLLEVFGGGIVALHARESVEQRKILAPAFRPKQMLGFLKTFNARSIVFVQHLNKLHDTKGEAHELLDDLRLCIINISRITTMGAIPLSTKLGDALRKHFSFVLNHWFLEVMLACVNLRWLIKYNPYYIYTRNKLVEISKQTLAYRMNTYNEELHQQNKLVIDHAYNYFKSGHITKDDLIGEITELLMGSFETTSNTIYSAMTMLAMHPDIQERLYDEIIGIFSNKSLTVEYEHLSQLVYLEMVIKETLRLFPPVPMIGREVTDVTPIQINDTWYNLPKNMSIIIDIAGLHRDTNVWGPNADKFNPDNFSRGNSENRSSYAYIPFSKGSRMCLGWYYGNVVLKVMLVHIIRNFRLTTISKYEDFGIEIKPLLVYTTYPVIQLHVRS